VQNGFIVTETSKTPFILDPEQQASKWLASINASDPTFTTLSHSHSAY